MAGTDVVQAQWHLDKKVPLALIGGIIAQTVILVIWAVNLSNTVSNLATDFSQHITLDGHTGMQINATRFITQQNTIISRQGEILDSLRDIDNRLRDLENGR